MRDLSNHLTISQFAGKLGVTVPTIRNYVKAGKIQPSMVCGSHMYFEPEAVNKYSGMILGKKRKGSLKIESFAVLYVTDNAQDEVPNELIDSAMKEKGFLPLEAYDYDKDIQPEELEDFDKFCESKSFYEILRTKVTKSMEEEIKKVTKAAEKEIRDRKTELYTSESYQRFEQTLLSATGEEKVEALKKKEEFDTAYKGLVQNIEATRDKLILEIRNQYSSEHVDEMGNIVDGAPSGSGVKYAKIFNELRKKRIKEYRYAQYPTMKHYTVFSVVANDWGTYETPFENIFSGAYDGIFVINISRLSEDWRKVLDIINKSGVANIEELFINNKVSVSK